MAKLSSRQWLNFSHGAAKQDIIKSMCKLKKIESFYKLNILRSFDIYYRSVFKTTKMEHFVKIVVNCKPLTIFARCSIFYVWQGSEYDNLLQTWLLLPTLSFHFKICCHRKILRTKGSKCLTLEFIAYKSYTSQPAIVHFPTGHRILPNRPLYTSQQAIVYFPTSSVATEQVNAW